MRSDLERFLQDDPVVEAFVIEVISATCPECHFEILMRWSDITDMIKCPKCEDSFVIRLKGQD